MNAEGAVLLLSFVLLMAMGLPIVFSIALSTTITLAMSMPLQPAATTVAQRMATGVDSFPLMAIPFFILAGQLMNHGGIARRLIDFAKALVGMLPGGLAHVNILAAMLMGAISGSAVASASAIGTALGPRMKKEGIDPAFGASVNITSATTGLLIPPSNVLIVYSLAAGGVSVAALFVAGYLPGILVGLLLMAVTGLIAWRRKYPASGLVGFGEGLRLFFRALPSLLLVVIVMGGIIAGVFTATEAAAVAVVYALILALGYREMSWRDLPKVLRESAVTTSVVLALVGASMGMSWVLAYENIPQSLSRAMLSWSDSPLMFFLVVNLILLIVGTFMDMTPAVLIFTPIFLPVAEAMGIDPVHFGIVMVLNLCIGLCTPPVGTVLFIGAGVSGLPVTRLIRPMLPLYGAMLLALIVVSAWPSVSLWLPRVSGLLK